MIGYLGLGAALIIAGTAVSAETPPAPGTAEPREKLICKRYAEPGRFIKNKRECRTAAEWQRVAEAAQDHGKYLQDNHRGGSSCQAMPSGETC